MVVFEQNGCIRSKVVVFGQNGCIQEKVVVIGQSGCNRVKEVVFVQKWTYFGKCAFIRAKRFFWEKLVVFGHGGCI